MKIMSYNILEGGLKRLPTILEVIKEVSPDFLVLQEVNSFAKEDNKKLKEVAEILGFHFYDIALATEYDYHVASFSKIPFKKVTKLPHFRNACLETVIESAFGEISICNTHLTPYTEDERLREIDLVINHQKHYSNKIILGDMNSLSPQDTYPNDFTHSFNQSQKDKYIKDGRLQFGVVNRLLANHYLDCSVVTKKNVVNTVPTLHNFDPAHNAKIRIDDVFISDSLVSHLHSFDVLKTEKIEHASDHYPIVAILASNN